MDGNTLGSYGGSLVARAGGLHPPPEVLLSWPRPNYVDPEERGWGPPILLMVVLGITFLVYCARMWARLVISKNFGLDDILVSMAMLPLFGLTISSVLGIRIYGFQWHVWDQTQETLVTTREIAFAIELNYMLTSTLIKVSILCFYRRIGDRLTNQFIYWVYGTIAFCIVYGIAFTIAIVFTCTPVIGFFRLFDISWRLQNELTCRNEGALIVACAVISLFQDFIICLLPVLLIWNLQISKRQKVGLCAIFGVGLITCICGIMRTFYAAKLYYFTYDITWAAYSGWVWTTLEAQLAVMCASAPSLKVFLGRYFSMYTSRAGYSQTGIPGQASGPSSNALSQGFTGKASQHSTQQSQCTAGSIRGDVPLEGIHITNKLDVRVEERDDYEQASLHSTKELTALPMSSQPGWRDGCKTVCAALRPGSRGTSATRGRSREGDVEAGRAY
ncbi:hypothetical protein J4E93_006684 [Alternaria ventricosa]|uniref:uncharacterized protein n=1 Tax=Alternaria ventricosa TaxID=1187951 RepID=UPI0020C1D4FC|nr:uncharacterized protein J4E93_006684 [Alternaria ventricosa]KAI4643672.1 hypothetical protein J4E93_006684 [Alternaria ventricosa]